MYSKSFWVINIVERCSEWTDYGIYVLWIVIVYTNVYEYEFREYINNLVCDLLYLLLNWNYFVHKHFKWIIYFLLHAKLILKVQKSI